MTATREGYHRTRATVLTPAEMRVLEGAAQGESAADTAKRLWIAEGTVKFHRTRIFEDLNARNIAHAVAIAYDRGILRPNSKHRTEAAIRVLRDACEELLKDEALPADVP